MLLEQSQSQLQEKEFIIEHLQQQLQDAISSGNINTNRGATSANSDPQEKDNGGDEDSESESNTERSKKRRKRPQVRTKLPAKATAVLKEWILEHLSKPYPTEEEKNVLKNKTGLSVMQITNWFSNARRRTLQRSFAPISHSYKHKRKETKPPQNTKEEKEGASQSPSPPLFVPP
jgi:hypothetical protein